MSRARGNALQRALADYLRDNGWPLAESTPNGRPGTDVLGTPGLVWENKTPRRFDPFEWAKQADGHVRAGELPVCVYWPDKVGMRRPQLAIGMMPLPALVGLLRASAWGPAAPGVMLP